MRIKQTPKRAAQLGVAAAVTASLVLGMSTGPAAAAVSSPVLGYQEEGDSTSLISASAGALEQVDVDGVNIASNGASVPAPDSTARAQLSKIHAAGKKAEFLIGNFIGSDFSEPAAYKLLSSTTNINAVVKSLKSSVSSQGWDGVQVDIESLVARDTTGLVNLLTALKQALPAGKTVSLAVTCFTSEQEFEDNGYNLWSIGQTVDRLVLMAYDQHGFGDSGPGPVGALSWQSNGLDIVLGEMNGATDKVVLGQAGYGYRWYSDWSNGHIDQVSDADARSLAGSQATWDATAHEWHATLSDGSVMWWADARSLTDRQSLVTDRGIHGLAVWDLALSDPITHA